MVDKMKKGGKRKEVLNLIRNKADQGEKYTWRQKEIRDSIDIDASWLNELLSKEVKEEILGKYEAPKGKEGTFYFFIDNIKEAEKELKKDKSMLPTDKSLNKEMITKKKQKTTDKEEWKKAVDEEIEKLYIEPEKKNEYFNDIISTIRTRASNGEFKIDEEQEFEDYVRVRLKKKIEENPTGVGLKST